MQLKSIHSSVAIAFLVAGSACGGGGNKPVVGGDGVEFQSSDVAYGEGEEWQEFVMDSSESSEAVPPPCPLGSPCDDGNPCTANDHCALDGACIGLYDCDDGNPCTIDECHVDQGCSHVLDQYNTGCRPQIVIDAPPRAATMNGAPAVQVEGHVEYGSTPGQVSAVTVNGLPRPVKQDDLSFVAPLDSSQGMNTIVAEVTDAAGLGDRVVQAWYWSQKWFAVKQGNPSASMVKDGLMLFLGPDVWDSNGKHMDLATVIELFAAEMDIGSLIPNPVTTGSNAGCKYEVYISNVKYGKPQVDLKPVKGGLWLHLVIPNFSAHVKVKMSGLICPDVEGDAKASSIDVTATLSVSLDGNGNPVVKLVQSDVAVKDFDLDIDGIWGFLFNWLIDFFEDDLAGMIEKEFEKQLASQIQKAVADALKSLALEQEIEVPALIPGGKPLKLTLHAKLSTLEFDDLGAEVGLAATVVAPKATQHEVLGSIGRASCQDGGVFAFAKSNDLEVGLGDDVLNQIPFGMFWGGALAFPIDAAALGQDLSQYGVSDLVATVDFLLPPIVTSCSTGGKWMVQAGDIAVDASFTLLATGVKMKVYASLSAEAHLTASNGKVAVSIDQPAFLDLEVASAESDAPGVAEGLGEMIKTTLMPKILEQVVGKDLASFPIPEIDMGALNPALKGKKIAIDIKKLTRKNGYWVVAGGVK